MAVENDLIMIYFEDKPLMFARIESILPDHKPDWYHVKLLLLQVPLQIVTWILRDTYIGGAEFTMNGKRMRLEKIEAPEDPQPDAVDTPPEKSAKQDNNADTGKIISFSDLKKDK